MKERLGKIFTVILSVLVGIPLVALAIDVLLVLLYFLAFFASVGTGGGPPLADWFIEGGPMPEPIAAVLGLLIILGAIGAVEFFFLERNPGKRVKKAKKEKEAHRAPFDYWS